MRITVIVDYDECTRISKSYSDVPNTPKQLVDTIKACGWEIEDRMDQLGLLDVPKHVGAKHN